MSYQPMHPIDAVEALSSVLYGLNVRSIYLTVHLWVQRVPLAKKTA